MLKLYDLVIFIELKGVGIGEYIYGIGKILGNPYARQVREKDD